ncbi:LAFE_0H00936g1_1 [Lachancea fermentati]|uniref:LAFE_0H00936g1_1 n=1 Tax=Lachancea fermentati TaxID=4955 RepID=A0A1G4MJ03_LACFM|nr:LAFE_0H00936g1_1 [Lachancea fermentati]
MSRAKEIKEKLALQAQLQSSFNDTNLQVSKWLDGVDSTGDKNDVAQSKASFYQLPVIGIGSGLVFDDKSDDKEDISTIGEFIDSKKKVASLAKKKKRNVNQEAKNNGLYTSSANDTKAMTALKRKIRKDYREKTLRSEVKESVPASSTSKGKNEFPNDSEEDSDEDPKVEKVAKKSFGLLFDGKKKRKANR